MTLCAFTLLNSFFLLQDEKKYAKAVFEGVCAEADQAFIFFDKVNDIFQYGEDTEAAKEALRERGDKQPLMRLLKFIVSLIAEAVQKYILFKACHEKVSQSCSKPEETRRRNLATVVPRGAGVRRAAVAAAVAAAVGIAGVTVIGIGALVGAGVAAVTGSEVAGAIGFYATAAGIVHYFNKVTFGEILNDMRLATLNMKEDIDKIESHVQDIQRSVKDVQSFLANNHPVDAICRELDRQQEKFTECRATAASRRQNLMSKNVSLKQRMEQFLNTQQYK